jgi:hypothetical protein
MIGHSRTPELQAAPNMRAARPKGQQAQGAGLAIRMTSIITNLLLIFRHPPPPSGQACVMKSEQSKTRGKKPAR